MVDDEKPVNREDQEEIRNIFDQVERKQSARKSQVDPKTIENLNQLRKSSVGEVDEQELRKQVSKLLNEEKEKVI